MTKEELKQYRRLGAELERLDGAIARVKSEIESPKRQILTGMPHGGEPVTMEDKIAKLLDIQDLYNRQRDKLMDLMWQIETAIAKVQDSRSRTLLGYKYIDGLSWEEVAEKMGLSDKWVRTDLHAKALREIAKSRGVHSSASPK